MMKTKKMNKLEFVIIIIILFILTSSAFAFLVLNISEVIQ